MKEFMRRHLKISPQATYKALRKHAALQLPPSTKPPKPEVEVKAALAAAKKFSGQLEAKLEPLEARNKKLTQQLVVQEKLTTAKAQSELDATKAVDEMADELKKVKHELGLEKAKVAGHVKEIEKLKAMIDKQDRTIAAQKAEHVKLRERLAKKITGDDDRPGASRVEAAPGT